MSAFWKPCLVFLAASLLLPSCRYARLFNRFYITQLTSSDRQIRKSFKGQAQNPEVFYFKSGGRKIRAWQIGADTLPVSLLLHGAPSSMVKFREWFSDSTLYQKTRLVAVDRPGYGQSGLGKPEVSIGRQAEILAPLLEKLSARGPITLFGSSYGGSVAIKLAMNHPEKVKSLVLLSASAQPGAEAVPKIAWKVRKRPWLFPRVAKAATREKFAHETALWAIQDGWRNIRCPVWLMHGQSDSLIYFSNAEFARERLVNADVRFLPFPNSRHNIFWANMDTVRHCLLEAVSTKR